MVVECKVLVGYVSDCDVKLEVWGGFYGGGCWCVVGVWLLV